MARATVQVSDTCKTRKNAAMGHIFTGKGVQCQTCESAHLRLMSAVPTGDSGSAGRAKPSSEVPDGTADEFERSSSLRPEHRGFMPASARNLLEFRVARDLHEPSDDM